MKDLLIIDPVCPKPYSAASLDREGMGGTEATVIRIAEALGPNRKVVVAQHCRTEVSGEGAASAAYTPLYKTHMSRRNWGAVVVLRHPVAAIEFRKMLHKDTPMWLWLHDLVPAEMCQYGKQLADLNIGVICVSEFHRSNFLGAIRVDKSVTRFPPIKVLYNPIADALTIDDTPVDKNKLVFFSSPQKGLSYALEMFKVAHGFNPELRLHVSNPGYLRSSGLNVEGVVDRGVLRHVDVIKEVRSAMCVFYPNYVFPETFGLVFAEANAVGTPVLTHPIGAAREVLNGDWQLMDVRKREELIARLMAWHQHRPQVCGQDKFRLSNVIKQWEDLLNGESSESSATR